jgi:uncharacterized membrane protein YoaK (UPF0700 family)
MSSSGVDLRVRDRLIYTLTASSGAIDTISFVALGKVFSAFMTGNIAFLGIRVSGAASSPGVVRILAAMVGFSVGVFFGNRIVKASAGVAVWPGAVTVALCVSLIAEAVFLVAWFASRGQPSVDLAHFLLGSWGVAMGVQAAAVRSLHMEGVYATAATATLVGYVVDLTGGPQKASERRAYAGVLAWLFAGATAGGLLLVHAYLYAPVLPFVLTGATIATAVALGQPPSGEPPRAA